MTTPRYRWQPTTAEIASAAGIDPSAVIRFDHNTSPYPSEWTKPLLDALAGGLNEYPGASYAPLRAAAAAVAGTGPEWVVPGAGIDELILLSARAFLRPGDVAVGLTPTYPLYRIATAQAHAHWQELWWQPPSFTTVDGDPGAPGPALVWMCTPNNPTGHDVDPTLIDAVLATGAVVVLDAAYAEFVGDRWAPLVEAHPNLVVLHTLSKAYGLAGLRVGYALAHPDMCARLDAVRPPGSLSTLSAAIGAEALRTIDPAPAVSAITGERDRLGAGLAACGFTPLPSRCNFLLCHVGATAGAYADRLQARGLIVRSFEGPLAEYLRVTVRSPAEDDRLLDTLQTDAR